MDKFAGIILGAGEGLRMRSRIPKVLHRLCGKELIQYPVDLVRELGLDRTVVVVSPDNQDAIRLLLGDSVEYVVQPFKTGTAGAAEAAMDMLMGTVEQVVIMGADSPLVTTESLQLLIDQHVEDNKQMSILSGVVKDATGLGRIVRDLNRQQNVTGIFEAEEDLTRSPESTEVNSGVYCFEASWLRENLQEIKVGHGSERYLPHLAAIAFAQGKSVSAMQSPDPFEVRGINNRVELANLENVQRRRIKERLMLDGVTISDPDSVSIDADVKIGQDTVILPNTMILGNTVIGSGCEVGPASVLRSSLIGDDCRITMSVVEDSVMEFRSEIGPFSHLRTGSYLESSVHIGNYVEVKESRFAVGSRMGHFGYIGDASIGANVNVGAGTVTCNYDGNDKHRTIVENEAFLGCDTMLVAPVIVGAGATTGAGAVVTKNVPPAGLVVGVPARMIER